MKKKQRSLILIIAALFTLLLTASAVQAAGIRMTSASQKSVKVGWDTPASSSPVNINYFTVSWGKNSSSLSHTKRVAGTSRSLGITGLKPNNRYTVKLECNYTVIASGNTYNMTLASLTVQTVPGKVSAAKTVYNFGSSQNGFYLNWPAPSGDGYSINYQVAIRNLSGKTLKTFDQSSRVISSTSFTLKQVARAYIRGYIKVNGKNCYGPWASKPIIPQPILSDNTSKSYIDGNGKLHLSWSRVSGATGYNVYVSTTSSRSGYTRVGRASGSASGVIVSSYKGSSYKTGTTYYIKVLTTSKIGNSNGKDNFYYMSVRRYIIYR